MMSAAEGQVDLESAPASATAVAARVQSARAATLRAWVPALLALVLLDVTFNLWFWRIPKLTPPSADYGYQFLTDAHAMAATPKTPGVPRVLAIGSSVAGAFDPAQVEGLLTAAAAPAEVERLLLPGIKPSDLRLFFATDGASLDPDVVVVLLNPLDFLNPSFERDLKPQVRNVLPPGAALRERGEFIPTLAGKLDLAVAAISNVYRYRESLRACVEDHLRLAWRWLRGDDVSAGYGWDADGYTRQDFALPVGVVAAGIDYYIDPRWLAQRGVVRLTFATAGGVLAERTEATPGWKHVDLAGAAGHGDLVYVSADSTWSPRATDPDGTPRLLGVLLREVPDGRGVRERTPLRYPPLERRYPDTLLRMQGAFGAEFVSRWRALLDGDNEFGRRFRAYRDTKLAERDTPLTPGGEYAELERLVREFTASGATVLLVNNPESELLRSQYAHGAYYESYLDFLEGVAARTPGVRFRDLGAALPIDDFNDWHHVTYIGAIKLGPQYAAMLQPLVGGPAAAP